MVLASFSALNGKLSAAGSCFCRQVQVFLALPSSRVLGVSSFPFGKALLCLRPGCLLLSCASCEGVFVGPIGLTGCLLQLLLCSMPNFRPMVAFLNDGGSL